ncbi:MAG: hypothetical protein ACREEB_11365 [Caulobacteraceae bacterium]
MQQRAASVLSSAGSKTAGGLGQYVQIAFGFNDLPAIGNSQENPVLSIFVNTCLTIRPQSNDTANLLISTFVLFHDNWATSNRAELGEYFGIEFFDVNRQSICTTSTPKFKIDCTPDVEPIFLDFIKVNLESSDIVSAVIHIYEDVAWYSCSG